MWILAVELKDAASQEGTRTDRRKAECARVSAIYRQNVIHLSAPGSNLLIDLFPIIPDGRDGLQMFMEGMKLRSVPRDFVLPLSKIEFLGVALGSPANPEAFLAERYGEDWRVPRRKFKGMLRIPDGRAPPGTTIGRVSISNI